MDHMLLLVFSCRVGSIFFDLLEGKEVMLGGGRRLYMVNDHLTTDDIFKFDIQ